MYIYIYIYNPFHQGFLKEYCILFFPTTLSKSKKKKVGFSLIFFNPQVFKLFVSKSLPLNLSQNPSVSFQQGLPKRQKTEGIKPDEFDTLSRSVTKQLEDMVFRGIFFGGGGDDCWRVALGVVGSLDCKNHSSG